MVPIRVLVSIAVIAAIAGLCYCGMREQRVAAAEARMEVLCQHIVAELSSLVAGGSARDLGDCTAPPGTRRILAVELPGPCLYLCFGADPDPDDDGVLTTALLHSTAVMVYRVQGGGTHAVWLPYPAVGFRSCSPTDARVALDASVIVQGPGKTVLSFELVSDSHGMYILVSRL
jgi:hypothetical protein